MIPGSSEGNSNRDRNFKARHLHLIQRHRKGPETSRGPLHKKS